MESTVIAVDVHKSVFQLAVSELPGQVKESRRLSRAKMIEFFTRREPSLVVMEACGSAHHLGRKLVALGHEVRLLPPHRTKPYTTGHKHDRADAKGLLEASRNEEICPVPVKSVEDQALAVRHRVRDSMMRTRTRQLNQLRGICREYGVSIPVGASKVVPAVHRALSDDLCEIPPSLHRLLLRQCEAIKDLESQLDELETELKQVAKDHPDVQRLMTIPGIGVLSATALVAWVGDVTRFPSSRHLASYLGLVSKEHSSGNRRRQGRISKQGNRYLRTLMIHGARSLLRAARRKQAPSPLQCWALELQARRGHNTAVVALANRTARVVWAVWTQQRTYLEPAALPAAS